MVHISVKRILSPVKTARIENHLTIQHECTALTHPLVFHNEPTKNPARQPEADQTILIHSILKG